jgi:hypothetical protein
MKKFSIANAVIGMSAGILGGYLVWQAARDYLWKDGEDPRSKEYLSRVAAEINRSVPIMIDKETELLPSAAEMGMLIYNYRLVSFSAAQIDPHKFSAAAKQQVIQGACSRSETRDGFLKKGVTLRYAYYDKDKRHIATVDVMPSNCGL